MIIPIGFRWAVFDQYGRKKNRMHRGEYFPITPLYPTALQIHNRTVFEEMKPWTALTMHLGMKTEF